VERTASTPLHLVEGGTHMGPQRETPPAKEQRERRPDVKEKGKNSTMQGKARVKTRIDRISVKLSGGREA